MATSGSIDFSISRDDIIEEALMHLGALGEGQAPSADQLTDHARTLNIMVKAWQNRGLNLWAIQRLTMALEEGKKEYILGTDHIAESFTRTELSADAASGASTISVDSATGISNGYYIGVEQDDGSMHWTTVNGAPSGTTVTLTSALTDEASTDNQVYVYSSKYNALGTKEILQAYIRDKDLNDTPIFISSRTDYHNLAVKGTDGQVHTVYFQPNLTAGYIYVYPEADNETDTLEFVVKRTLEDFDAAGDTPDFPQTWYEALYLGLAYRLARVYGKSLEDRKELRDAAEEALWMAESNDIEHGTSIFFQPSRM